MERKAPGNAGAKLVKRKRSSRTVAVVKLGSSVGIQEVEHGGWHKRANSETRVTMSTPEEQMATAVQQSSVRLRGTMATILKAERNDLVEQVQNATSTTTQRQPEVVDTRVIGRPGKFDEDPMKHADQSSKLRSYLGAMDQVHQVEPTTTEDSSTPRLNATLSTQMYYTPVMKKTLYKCHNLGINEGFAAWRQFVMEWEPRFVGLLRNVLSCRRKDDIPTQLAAVKGPIHESQSSETVNDDI